MLKVKHWLVKHFKMKSEMHKLYANTIVHDATLAVFLYPAKY